MDDFKCDCGGETEFVPPNRHEGDDLVSDHKCLTCGKITPRRTKLKTKG